MKPHAYKDMWLWEGQTGFADSFTKATTMERRVIAVAPRSYPEMKLTKDDALQLEKHISERITKVGPPGIPRFTSAYEEEGALVAVCADGDTLHWLRSLVQETSYTEMKLKVGVKMKIPFWKISFVSPEALMKESPEELLEALVLQNPELNGMWAIQGTEKLAAGMRVDCLVNGEVLSAIPKMEKMAFLGMHLIELNVQG